MTTQNIIPPDLDINDIVKIVPSRHAEPTEWEGQCGRIIRFNDDRMATVEFDDRGNTHGAFWPNQLTRIFRPLTPPAADATANTNAITAVIFPDPVAWLHEERESVEQLDNHSSMYLGGKIDMDAAIAITVYDDEEDDEVPDGKTRTPDELVEALRTLCELVNT